MTKKRGQVTELTDLIVDEVSAVDRGANGRKFLIVKREVGKAIALPLGGKAPLLEKLGALAGHIESSRTGDARAHLERALQAANELVGALGSSKNEGLPPGRDDAPSPIEEAVDRMKELLAEIETAAEMDDADEQLAARSIANAVSPIAELLRAALDNMPEASGEEEEEGDDMPPEMKDKAKEQEIEKRASLAKKLGVEADDEKIGARLDQLIAAEKRAADLEAKSKADAEEASKLATRVAELEAKHQAREHEAVFKRLSDEGKLPESLHAWARKQSVAGLAEWGEAAPVVMHQERVRAKGAPAAGGAGPTDSDGLSDVDREVAAKLGLSLEKMAEAKKRVGVQRSDHLRLMGGG